MTLYVLGIYFILYSLMSAFGVSYEIAGTFQGRQMDDGKLGVIARVILGAVGVFSAIAGYVLLKRQDRAISYWLPFLVSCSHLVLFCGFGAINLHRGGSRLFWSAERILALPQLMGVLGVAVLGLRVKKR